MAATVPSFKALGSDLALTRYSGRPVAPPSDRGVIARVGGDAEAICAGWWAGDERVQHPAFFAYGYPAPDGLGRAPVQPAEAAWSGSREDAVRALYANPLVLNVDLAERVYAALAEAHRAYLPERLLAA